MLYLWDYVQMAEGEELWVKQQLPDSVSSGIKQQLWGPVLHYTHTG